MMVDHKGISIHREFKLYLLKLINESNYKL